MRVVYQYWLANKFAKGGRFFRIEFPNNKPFVTIAGTQVEPGDYCQLAMNFARRKDAEIGIKVCKRFGIRTVQDVLNYGREYTVRLICENLQW